MPSGYSTTAAGGALVPEQVAALLIEPLLAEAVVLRARPRIFTAQGAPVLVPKILSLDLADAWRSENTLIGESDPIYGEVQLLPTALKSLKVLHRLSNELARNAGQNVAQALSVALVRRVANAVDKAFLVGDGASSTIVGLANQTGVQSVAAVGSPTVDDLHDAEGLLLTANGSPESAAWFLAPRTLTSLRKLREGGATGAYLLQPDPAEGGGYQLLGHPVFVTTQIPVNTGAGANESVIILADMSQVAVGRDQDISVTLLPERFADFDQLGIRVTARFDIAPLNAAAIVVLRGVTA
jgi:HK97 family phage major capsid protein